MEKRDQISVKCKEEITTQQKDPMCVKNYLISPKNVNWVKKMGILREMMPGTRPFIIMYLEENLNQIGVRTAKNLIKNYH